METLSPTSQQIEKLLSGEKNPLLDVLRQESLQRVEASGFAPSQYDIFAVRTNPTHGNEIFGPKKLLVGSYSEADLYGLSGSPLLRFRSAVRALKSRAEQLGSLNPEDVEYSHQAALMWADVGRLKQFLGTSAAISELVSEFRTARFQFLGKDTPPHVFVALDRALGLVAEAERIDLSLVDQVVDALEKGGVDSLASESLRPADE